MNTVSSANTSIPYRPAPTPPGVISPRSIRNSGTRPPSGVRLSCIALTAPVLVPVVTAAHRPPPAAPNRISLPSMFPSPWSRPAGNSGLAPDSARMPATAATAKMPAIAANTAQPWRRLPASTPNVAVSENGMTRIEQLLEEVRERRGVLERVRGVRVDDPAAVGAELLDRLLRGDRAQEDGLRAAFEACRGRGAGNGLRHALPDEHERRDERDREQDVEGGPGEVDPEVADRRRGAPGDPAHERDRDRESHGRGREVLDREAGGLGRDAPSWTRPSSSASWCCVVKLTAVLSARSSGTAPAPGRVERERRLEPLLEVQHEDRDEAEDEQRAGVGAPALLARRVGAGEAVHAPLDRARGRGPAGAAGPRGRPPCSGRGRG